MESKKILVLGIGNILLKDEGIGVRIVKYLQKLSFPSNVELMDGGTATTRLLGVFAETDHLIVIDAVKGNMPPGTVYRLTPRDLAPDTGKGITSHDMGLIETLEMAWHLEKKPETVDIFGIEPLNIEWGMQLSPEIERLIPVVSRQIRSRIEELLQN